MLPKINYPLNAITVPSNGKKIKMRPMLVREEKILLMARESDDPIDRFSAVKQVIQNCVIDDDFDVDKIATFDLEWLFMKLRAFSVGNIVRVTYVDPSDEKEYIVSIDINDIKMDVPKNNNVIKVTDEVGFTLRYPSGTEYDDKEFMETKDAFFLLTVKCIDKVYDGDSVVEAKNCTRSELEDFVNSLPSATYEKVIEFFSNVPTMKYEVTYTNSLGEKRDITLSKLEDFFTF